MSVNITLGSDLPALSRPGAHGAERLFTARLAVSDPVAPARRAEDHDLNDIGLARGAVPDGLWAGLRVGLR